MKPRILFFLITTLFIDLTVNNLNGQPSSNTSTKTVYLHTDRSYYAPGEDLYFKAYILDSQPASLNQINDTLYVALLDYEGNEVTNGEFPIDNSLFSSSINIPDFLTEGSYMLLASISLTNNYSPSNIFSKIVELRNTKDSDLNIDLSLSDSIYKPESNLTAHIKISGSDSPVNFTYQLTGISGEIMNGKGKTTGEGTAVIKLQLPDFDSHQVLKLLIKPSYKGNKKVAAIVIPTSLSELPAKSIGANSSANYLNIQVSTSKQVFVTGEKVQLSISVTDEKGLPVRANLSVSASKSIPLQFPVDYNNMVRYINFKTQQTQTITVAEKNILTPDTYSLFSAENRSYYAQSLRSLSQTPGRSFIVEEKNNVKKIHKRQEAFVAKSGYSSDFSLMDIIMQIKPYHLENGKITFGMRAMNSINFQEGALIVVDGVKLGSDASILNTIPVQDIAHINILTSAMDIQRYSALNSVGVIEISMKKSEEFTKNQEPVSKGNTLYWEPDLIIDNTGKKMIDFPNNDIPGEVIISINGINGKGIYGSTSLHYSVTR